MLPYTYLCAPNEACRLSAASDRLNLLQWISGISATQCLLLPFLPVPVHPQARTLFTQRHGGWTPFTHREERKQRWDTGKKSSRDMQTRASVWAQTAAERCGYFWSRRGFTQWSYISGIPLVSALKREFSSCSKELKQQGANFRRDASTGYISMRCFSSLNAMTLLPSQLKQSNCIKDHFSSEPEAKSWSWPSQMLFWNKP